MSSPGLLIARGAKIVLLALMLAPCGASVARASLATGLPNLESQARRPFLPMRPSAPSLPSRSSSGSATHAEPTTIRYSQSAMAANMVMPAIYLGLPTIFIIALIIRAMRGD